jgi:hypothetical protein
VDTGGGHSGTAHTADAARDTGQIKSNLRKRQAAFGNGGRFLFYKKVLGNRRDRRRTFIVGIEPMQRILRFYENHHRQIGETVSAAGATAGAGGVPV